MIRKIYKSLIEAYKQLWSEFKVNWIGCSVMSIVLIAISISTRTPFDKVVNFFGMVVCVFGFIVVIYGVIQWLINRK